MSFDMWNNADPDAIGGGNDLNPPADGMYDAEVLNATAFESKKGNLTVKLDLRVVSVQEQGYEWTVLLGFKSQGQANMTKRQVRNMGVPVDQCTSLTMLDEALGQTIGKYITVDVKTSGEFRNTYIQEGGPVGSDIPIPDMPQPVAAQSTDDSDVPF